MENTFNQKKHALKNRAGKAKRRTSLLFVAAMMLGLFAAMPQRAKAQHPPLGGGNGVTAGSAYQISVPTHLADLANYVNGGGGTSGVYYKLTTNLDLSGYNNWDPIGNDEDEEYIFYGHFDGAGYTISNLTMEIPDSDAFGLFGNMKGGSIKNLGLVNVNIVGRSYTGALLGDANSLSQDVVIVIENCYVTGSVSGGSNLGGLVGRATGSYSENLMIKNCYSTAAVSAVSSLGSAGGLVGEARYTTVENCYTTGAVSASASGVGGLVGNNDYSSKVTNCYTTGAVDGNAWVGGVVGLNNGGSQVTNCYATGAVIGSSYVGGVVGVNQNNGTQTTNCVALNSIVKATGYNAYVGRVIGTKSNNTGNTISGLIAFEGIDPDGGRAFPTATGLAALNGASKTAHELQTASGFPAGFTSSPWTYEGGKLPGLNGQTVNMPEHLGGTFTPVPIFDGLANEYTAGAQAVTLKVTGAGSEHLAVFRVNGETATQFLPSAAGTYLLEALSTDGKLKIWRYVKVN